MWIGIAIAAVVVALWVVIRTGTISRGLRREHFAEILQGIAQIRATATGMEVRTPTSEAELATAPAVRTSVGLIILWTAVADSDEVVHTVSISGRGPSWAFRGTIIAFVMDRLGLPAEGVIATRRPSGVDLAQVRVSAAEHAALWARPLRPVPDTDFAGFLVDLRRRRDAMKFDATAVDTPT